MTNTSNQSPIHCHDEKTPLIYPQGIAETVAHQKNRLQGYTLVAVFPGGHGTHLALFQRQHTGGNRFAATDLIAIDTRGFISEISL